MINSVNSVNLNRSYCGGPKRQENLSFTATSSEIKKKAADIGEEAVIKTIKFGMEKAPVVKKAVMDTFEFLKKCTQEARARLNK